VLSCPGNRCRAVADAEWLRLVPVPAKKSWPTHSFASSQRGQGMAREPTMHRAERRLLRPASSAGFLYPCPGRGVGVDLLEGHDDRLTEEAVLVLRGSEQF